ncbi:aromatic amino acid ammonia-lyase [Streptomyces sp. NPDC048290]|uniref:HAL/PAL/TAL family ammonia-lyase n=1 Tax=Streptomyces sp. NPDC048290 TaxID=3155811 RepID=UPI0034283B96
MLTAHAPEPADKDDLPGPSSVPAPPNGPLLGDDSLSLIDVAHTARSPRPDAGGARPAIAPAARHRMERSVRVRDEMTASRRPVYGVTTGFGDSARFQLAAGKAAALQRNMVTYHLNGTGPIADPEVVRATMLIRANSLARGYSGIRPEVVDLLLDCLRHDITPLVPERGSVGASGDLVPLCYVADLLTGGGEARYAGRRVPAAEALRACGLRPVVLEAKEGLALINGTAFMAGFAVLAAADARELEITADLCTALAVEALRGNRDHFHPLVHTHKPHPGQRRSAARVRALLTGSRLCLGNDEALRPRPDVEETGLLALGRPVQDRYSVRCAPQVTGVLGDTLDWTERWLATEINSTNDNPLFDPESATVYNGGNFYGGHVGHAMDSLKLALAGLGDLLDRQLALLVDSRFSDGLPPNLAAPLPPDHPEAGLHHGFKGMQLTASALAAEALRLTMPATAFSRSTEAHNQDKVSMGTIAARDARTVAELVREVAAIQLLAGCQAADLRGPRLLGEGTRAGYELVRAHVPFVDRDRRMDGDLAVVARLVRDGAVGAALRPWQPPVPGVAALS